MICFEVSLNGKASFTAGVPDGLLHLYLHSFGGDDGIRLDVGATSSEPAPSDLAPKLRAALQHPEPRRIKHERWFDQRVHLGDEITVKIVDRPECDPPK